MQDLQFDRQEIQTNFPKYRLEKVLGKGSFGKVFLVTDRDTKQQLAVKKINCFGMCTYQRNKALNEVRILASLDHPNIVKFDSAMFDNDEEDLYIFMQYASEGDLLQLVSQAQQKKKRIPENIIWNVLLQISEGLDFLHKNKIIHRDIKPANIFKSSTGVYKLGDMNVSKIISQGDLAKTMTGSPLYTCPEVFNSKEDGYNQKCDVWSLGVVIFELCCLKAPYEALSIEELIRKQRVTKLKNIPTNYSCALNELIFEMLQTNPKKRISAEKIKVICLKHLKVSFEQNYPANNQLVQTVLIPESEQRWVNLLPLPPKASKKQPTNDRDSKQKSVGSAFIQKSNICYTQNTSIIVLPKAKDRPINQEKGEKEIVKVRLPSIRRNSFHQIENRSRDKSKEKVKEKSKEKSREKSREKSKEGVLQIEEYGSTLSTRIQRKMSYEFIKQVRNQIPNI